MDLYWGYRIYTGATLGVDGSGTLISEVVIASDYWNGGIDQTFANFNGYTGTFSFSSPTNTTYTFKLFFVCNGFQNNTGGSGASFTIDFNATTPSISATANVNVVELTNKGIQVASSADRFIKLRREDSASVPVLNAKGFIQIAGDTANSIIQLSGTAGGTAIDIASGTGQIDMNGNSISDVGGLTWNVSTSYTGSGALGGTIRGLEISLSNWKFGRNTSARRYKDDIQNWEHSSILQAINDTPIRTFYWKVDADKEDKPQQIGVIAEELEAAGLEEFVDYDWFEDPENPEGPKKWMTSGIAKQELVFVLWKAVQELSQKVKDLENKLNS